MGTLSGRPVDWAVHDRNEWRSQALCAQTDPEAFFVEKGGSTRAAKAVCARCPVRVACLDDAIESGDVHYGVRAGLAPRGLQAEAKRRGVSVAAGASVSALDWGAIQRVLDEGRRRPAGIRLTGAEGGEVVRVLRERGLSDGAIERDYHIKPERHGKRRG